MTLINPIGTDAAPLPAADPIRRSAEQLSQSFFMQMLKSSGLEKALGGEKGLGQSLGFLAAEVIAEKMSNASPQFVDQLYAQLRGMETSA